MEKTFYIILGAVVGLVLIILIACCCCCRKRKKTNNQQQTSVDPAQNSPEEDCTQSQISVIQTSIIENGQRASGIRNVDQTATYYLDDIRSTDTSYPGARAQLQDRLGQRETTLSSQSPTTMHEGDLNRRQGSLQINIAMENESQKRYVSDMSHYSPVYSRAAYGLAEPEGASEKITEFYSPTATKDPRFRSLVSNQVRDELNLILKKDSFNSPEQLSTDSPSPVYPSQLRELSVNLPKPERVHTKDNSPNMPSESNYPQIPQADYGTVSPATKPYKRREFKGPYGADDLDDMNNPYTLKRGKHKRLSVN